MTYWKHWLKENKDNLPHLILHNLPPFFGTNNIAQINPSISIEINTDMVIFKEVWIKYMGEVIFGFSLIKDVSFQHIINIINQFIDLL